VLQFLPKKTFRDKYSVVNETGEMRNTNELLSPRETAHLPVTSTLGWMAAGAGVSLVLGLGLGIVAAISRAQPAPATDLDELVRLRVDRARHAERASQLDHDLRTPIGTLATALEWMNSTPNDPGSQAEARQVMGRQITRMVAFTEELHQLAQQLDS